VVYLGNVANRTQRNLLFPFSAPKLAPSATLSTWEARQRVLEEAVSLSGVVEATDTLASSSSSSSLTSPKSNAKIRAAAPLFGKDE